MKNNQYRSLSTQHSVIPTSSSTGRDCIISWGWCWFWFGGTLMADFNTSASVKTVDWSFERMGLDDIETDCNCEGVGMGFVILAVHWRLIEFWIICEEESTLIQWKSCVLVDILESLVLEIEYILFLVKQTIQIGAIYIVIGNDFQGDFLSIKYEYLGLALITPPT